MLRTKFILLEFCEKMFNSSKMAFEFLALINAKVTTGNLNLA